MSEHDQHRKRVYKRFLEEGLSNFEEHNAMEFLLFLAKSRGDTNSLAHTLINQFGSLANALDASVEELESVPGVGETCAVMLKFIPQMCGYYLDNKSKNICVLDSVEEIANFFMPKFFGKTEEAFYAVCVDDRRRILRCELISEGTSNAATVSVAKVISLTSRCHATGVVVAHNHPRGITLPSSSDITITSQLDQALKFIGVELIDHFIFTENEYLSFAKTSYLSATRNLTR